MQQQQQKGYYCFILLAIAVALATGEECIPFNHNTCVFQCNGTTFDLSKLFDYPLNITDETYGGRYVWSPCKGIPCPPSSKTDSDSAVCQFDSIDCGQNKKPVFLWQQSNPYMFRIEYPDGIAWRMSVFQFIEDKAHPAINVTFVNQMPMLQYNFLVTGKCVGQPDCTP